MPVNESLGILLAETARCWRNKLDQRLKPLGVSQAKWRVLLHLNIARSVMTQKELSEKLGIEGPSLVRLLDRMEVDGWVERHPSQTDRRAKTVHLTDKANTMIVEIKQVAAKLRKELLNSISAAELATVTSVLQRIKQRTEQIN